jgi:hypothetical protein
MADLSPEASNAFKLPLFEISILKNKKRPRTLVQILSHGGARGICYVLPTVKKSPDEVIKKSANHTAEFAAEGAKHRAGGPSPEKFENSTANMHFPGICMSGYKIPRLSWLQKKQVFFWGKFLVLCNERVPILGTILV